MLILGWSNSWRMLHYSERKTRGDLQVGWGSIEEILTEPYDRAGLSGSRVTWENPSGSLYVPCIYLNFSKCCRNTLKIPLTTTKAIGYYMNPWVNPNTSDWGGGVGREETRTSPTFCLLSRTSVSCAPSLHPGGLPLRHVHVADPGTHSREFMAQLQWRSKLPWKWRKATVLELEMQLAILPEVRAASGFGSWGPPEGRCRAKQLWRRCCDLDVLTGVLEGSHMPFHRQGNRGEMLVWTDEDPLVAP